MADVRFADLFFTGASGQLYCLEESVDNIPDIKLGGVGVDGSSIPGFATVDKSDIILMPDVESKRTFAVEGEVVDAYFCNGQGRDGKAHPSCPRQALKRTIEKAEKMGLKFQMFSELEFYLLKDGKPNDQGGYLQLPPHDGGLLYRRDICRTFESAGIQVKRLHHEVGPGQHEVEYKLQPAMKNADDTLLGFWLAKMIAQKYGWTLDEMPKPFPELPGSGLHQHVLMQNLDGTNAMIDEEGEFNAKGKQFIAGMLKYARDVTSVFATSEQSYVRLQPGHEAPVYCTWGHASRNALVRVPTVSKATPEKIRVEFRAGDACSSPHLLCAMILAAGLRGIEEELELPEEPTINLDTVSLDEVKNMGYELLPRDLEESADVMEASPLVREVLGEPLQKVLAKRVRSQ
eukprot:TRINITY_DN6791_c0_g1_i1.p1 TRINITY_DN6791_c0_g1~~TRINITY_DN6791_c0_g1_i1.p1  ORF type:complete len:403 (-),score=125.41 TRINITY_DN6791_c0_g1_i1:281-1489(-)